MGTKSKKAFTLVEMIVVLCIMALLAAIAVPSVSAYWRLAEFRKNENNAKSMYLAAQSALTHYKTSGQLEEYISLVRRSGRTGLFPADTEKNRRIVAVTLDKDAYAAAQNGGTPLAGEAKAVVDLLDAYTYDKEILNGSICLEIDVEAGQVYSVFYAQKAPALRYEATGDQVSIADRTYETRRSLLVGYYSAEDLANVVDLQQIRLKIRSLMLLNGEALTLNWSSNSRADSRDVVYSINFYSKDDDSLLLSTSLDLAQHPEYQVSSDKIDLKVELPVAGVPDATKTIEKCYFPLSYQNGQFSLTLDAMMSARLAQALQYEMDKAGGQLESAPLNLSSNYSITRFGIGPQDIYAEVSVQPGDKAVHEYTASTKVRSNAANTLFDNSSAANAGTVTYDAKVSLFRHLSNIRHQRADQKTVFELTQRAMNWDSADVLLYDIGAGAGSGVDLLPQKQVHQKGKTLSFPTIPTLAEKHTLTGKSTAGARTIRNLQLGNESVAPDSPATGNPNDPPEYYAQYLGLFGENKGTITDIKLESPHVVVNIADTEQAEKAAQDGIAAPADVKLTKLQGVGVLCGYSGGNLTNISVIDTVKRPAKVLAALQCTEQQTGDEALKNGDSIPAVRGIGGVAGVLHDGSSKNLSAATAKTINNIAMSGTVTGVLVSAQEFAVSADELDHYANAREQYLPVGIGGVAGYSGTQNVLSKLSSAAQVTGNLYTGGLVGNLHAKSPISEGNLRESSNTGLVRCSVQYNQNNAATATRAGQFTGGIVGGAADAGVHLCTSSSGTSSNYRYQGEKEQLRGDFVGGIAGFCLNAQISDSGTDKNGYVLGSKFVGGIVGGFARREGGTSDKTIVSGTVTTNRAYVIGDSFVGGIAGLNSAGGTIENCVNTGVVAGLTRYVGGIVGRNDGNVHANASGDNTATITNCTSYVYDYNDAIYRMVSEEWGAYADYAGGIAGYNDKGIITYRENGVDINLNDNIISTIVTGKDYVGGVVGYNGVDGSIKVNFDIIGGKIRATGDCVGGFIGFNRSKQVLAEQVKVMPYSIIGRRFVGGVIGANIVATNENITVANFRALNSLATIEADGFAGGLIGYNRLVAPNAVDPSNRAFLPAVVGGNLLQETAAGTQTPAAMLVTDASNPGNNVVPTSPTNMLRVRANAYVGGIIGYNAADTRFLIANCLNRGDVARTTLHTGVGTMSAGVATDDYLRAAGYPQTALLGAEDNFSASFSGGIIGAATRNTVVQSCANMGGVTGLGGVGGIVGLSEGRVASCSLLSNLGTSAQDVIGGIAGVNIGALGGTTPAFDFKQNSIGAVAAAPRGSLYGSVTATQNAVSGRNTVGGIAGMNLSGGVVSWEKGKCLANAQVISAGRDAGGLVGQNRGDITFTAWIPQRVEVTSYNYAGGVVGYNAVGSKLSSVTVGNMVSVTATRYAGGIMGRARDMFDSGSSAFNITSFATVVAYEGDAGGIAGRLEGGVLRGASSNGSVRTNSGLAGGIVAHVPAGATVAAVENVTYLVQSGNGDVGGVAALCEGTIDNATVKYTALRSDNALFMGAIATQVGETGVIKNSKVQKSVSLISRRASVYGGAVGTNEGTVDACTVEEMPSLQTDGVTSSLTVGGIAGVNRATAPEKGLRNCVSKASFKGFTQYRYLGGVVGQNLGMTYACGYEGGTITQTAVALPGSAYGGIAGINGTLEGAQDGSGNIGIVLKDCRVLKLTASANGLYAATASQTSEEKAEAALSMGGVAGRNAPGALVDGCVLDGQGRTATGESDFNHYIRTTNGGILGGIVGFNQGSINASGYYRTDANNTRTLMTDETTGQPLTSVEKLKALAASSGNVYQIAPETRRSPTSVQGGVYYYDTLQKDAIYADKTENGQLRFSIEQRGNGHAAGIAGINTRTGTLSYCASGKWWVYNKSDEIAATCGGVIGLNEAEGELKYLLNQAYVFRETSTAQTDRFAGGIISNQENRTTSTWRIYGCVNYGKVYSLRSHYAGGMAGRWSYNGGTFEQCYNYGTMETTYQQAWKGAGAGIVACLHRPTSDQVFNIISSQNHASVLRSRHGNNDLAYGANDSAGILGNVTPYLQRQNLTINIIDCVNGAKGEIYSTSMAAGILCFLSADGSQNGTYAENVRVNIDRCRNYSKVLDGASSAFDSGIFGDRYGGTDKTYITNCINVTNNIGGTENRQLENAIAYHRGGSGLDATCANNYYIRLENRFFEIGLQQRDFTLPGFQTPRRANTTDIMIGSYKEKGTNVEKGYYSRKLEQGGADNADSNRYTILDGKIYLYWSGDSEPKAVVTQNLDSVIHDVTDEMIQKYYRETLDAKKLKAVTLVSANGGNGSEYDVTWNDPNKADADSRVMWYEMEVYSFPQGAALPDVIDDASMAAYTPMLTGLKYFSTNGIFTVPENCANFIVRVRAANSNAASASDWAYSKIQEVAARYSAPELRGELTADGRYSFTLMPEILQKNNATGTEWMTNIVLDSTKGVLRASSPSVTIAGSGYKPLSAITEDVAGVMRKSSQYVAQTFVPTNGNLVENSVLSNFTANFTGTKLDTLTCTLELTDDIGTAPAASPIYRVELLQNNLVVASSDVLIKSKGSVQVSFTEFDKSILDAAKPVQARCWYAQTGLGPIYTYHEVKGTETPNISFADGSTGLYSIIVANPGNKYTNFKREINNLARPIYWAAPTLDQADGSELVADATSDNSLRYTFSWTPPTTDSDAKQYAVSLTGIRTLPDGSQIAVPIDVSGSYWDNTATSFSVSADNWTYEKVTLTVQRLGSESPKYAVGDAVSATYQVARRLPQIGQPSLNLLSKDDLVYDISWASVQDPDYVGAIASYQLWVQDSLGQNKMFAELKEADADFTQSTLTLPKLDLEPYAGQTIQLYLIATPKDSNFKTSPAGYKLTESIQNRRTPPSLNSVTLDSKNVDGTLKFVSAQEFRNTALTLRANTQQSILGNYLYTAYFYPYEDQAAAQDALNAALAMPPTEPQTMFHYGKDTPVSLDPTIGSAPAVGFDYHSTMQGLSTENAGRWVIARMRGVTGDEISSTWTYWNSLLQLPGVKLDKTQQALITPAVTLKGFSYMLPTFEDVSPVPFEAPNTQVRNVEWEPIDEATGYDITITHVDPVDASDGATRAPLTLRAVLHAEDGSIASLALIDAEGNEQPLTAQTDADGNQYYDVTGLDAANPAGDYVMKGKYALPDGATAFYKFVRRPLLYVNQVENESGEQVYRLMLPDTARRIFDADEKSHNFTKQVTVTATNSNTDCFQNADPDALDIPLA